MYKAVSSSLNLISNTLVPRKQDHFWGNVCVSWDTCLTFAIATASLPGESERWKADLVAPPCSYFLAVQLTVAFVLLSSSVPIVWDRGWPSVQYSNRSDTVIYVVYETLVLFLSAAQNPQ